MQGIQSGEGAGAFVRGAEAPALRAISLLKQAVGNREMPAAVSLLLGLNGT